MQINGDGTTVTLVSIGAQYYLCCLSVRWHTTLLQRPTS